MEAAVVSFPEEYDNVAGISIVDQKIFRRILEATTTFIIF